MWLWCCPFGYTSGTTTPAQRYAPLSSLPISANSGRPQRGDHSKRPVIRLIEGFVRLIPVFRPTVDDAEIRAVTEVLKSGWWGLGPKTREFEVAFANYLGTAHAVGLNSCSAALHLGLKVLNVEGGEVITTPMTFVSTNHAILYNNAVPVFADIEPDTLNIDPADVERLITNRTKAIVVVHFGGHSVDLDRISELAREHGIPVLEDAAHACGSEYKGQSIGTCSEITCFSFHAVKNLAMGEGGQLPLEIPNLTVWSANYAGWALPRTHGLGLKT